MRHSMEWPMQRMSVDLDPVKVKRDKEPEQFVRAHTETAEWNPDLEDGPGGGVDTGRLHGNPIPRPLTPEQGGVDHVRLVADP